MKNNNLEYRIIQLFEKHPQATLKIRELSAMLHIKKHQFRDLHSAVKKLTNERILLKEGKYIVLNKYLKKNTKKTENDHRTSSRKGNLVEGIFDATSLAKSYSFGFVSTDDGDYFISSEDLDNAYHGDKVLIEGYVNNKGKKYGSIKNILSRASTEFVGNITLYGNEYIFNCDNSKIHTTFRVEKSELNLDKKKVALKILNWGNKEQSVLPKGKVVEILGEADDPETEILGVIRQFGLSLNFSPELIEEANNLSDFINKETKSSRKDFTKLLTITIDPKTAKDFDDAISLEKTDKGFNLYVHIADVGHFVKPGSELFKEAVNRGNSFYFPRKVIPMLPEQVSNKLCSLRPNEEKLTLSVITEFNPNFDIVKQYAVESIINSDARLNYEEVDQYLESGELNQSDEVKALLDNALKLSKMLSLEHYKQGYINFRLPDVEYIYDDEGRLSNIVEAAETDSHKMIENFMLVANEFIATYLKEHAKATIYRIHEFPDLDRIKKLSKLLKFYDHELKLDVPMNQSIQQLLESFDGEAEEKVFNKMILRSMKKAIYTIKNLPHFGLSIENYTHFTSPIRRLSDLIIHLQLKQLIGNDGYKFKKQTIFEYAKIATEREIISDGAYREILKKMVLYFMKEKIGNEYRAVISGMNNSNMFVTLMDFPITGVLKMSNIQGDYYVYHEERMQITGKRKKKTFRLAQQIDVQLTSVTDDIYFDLIEE